MIELFANVPEEKKKVAELIFNSAISQRNILKTVKRLNDYTNLIQDEEELEFVRFYFNMRMEQIYENIGNQWQEWFR